MKGLSPRQSTFGWLLCHRKLPTDDIMRKKGISLASKCIMCGFHSETLPHLFLNCSVSRIIWENFLSCFGLIWKDQSSIAELISWWKRKRRILSVKDPWAAGLIIVTDTIWKERNHRWHGGKSRDASLLFKKILRTLKESNLDLKGVIRSTADLLCCRKLGLHAAPGDPPSILEVIWCKPPLAWSKIKIDGSSMENPGRAGGGVVIRDSNGKVIFSFKNFLGISMNYYAEFMSFLHGIRHAMGQRITNLWIETDSVAVVTAVQGKSLPWFALQKWLSLQHYLNSISWKITHCFREANPIADYLAKSAAKTGLSGTMKDFPTHIIEEIRWDSFSKPRFRL
ncbi:uncharacterized protein LOC122064185 [Macadamia integrifolia]|uniref:uncharacterized protein LOC122064185 n=1 Tax=Macadamia integrifolia TaxID=60698 RepID=UPI001C4EDE33|nr:uncharacterized protein LOC122064185 [Macadamia integrifolia]